MGNLIALQEFAAESYSMLYDGYHLFMLLGFIVLGALTRRLASDLILVTDRTAAVINLLFCEWLWFCYLVSEVCILVSPTTLQIILMALLLILIVFMPLFIADYKFRLSENLRVKDLAVGGVVSGVVAFLCLYLL